MLGWVILKPGCCTEGSQSEACCTLARSVAQRQPATRPSVLHGHSEFPAVLQQHRLVGHRLLGCRGEGQGTPEGGGSQSGRCEAQLSRRHKPAGLCVVSSRKGGGRPRIHAHSRAAHLAGTSTHVAGVPVHSCVPLPWSRRSHGCASTMHGAAQAAPLWRGLTRGPLQCRTHPGLDAGEAVVLRPASPLHQHISSPRAPATDAAPCQTSRLAGACFVHEVQGRPACGACRAALPQSDGATANAELECTSRACLHQLPQVHPSVGLCVGDGAVQQGGGEHLGDAVGAAQEEAAALAAALAEQESVHYLGPQRGAAWQNRLVHVSLKSVSAGGCANGRTGRRQGQAGNARAGGGARQAVGRQAAGHAGRQKQRAGRPGWAVP